MFDIGFPELVMVSIVALLVIGPEKLPETIRTLSLWIGRLQRSFTNIRREIEQEIGADDIRAQLHNESIMKDLEETQNTIRDVHRDVKNTIQTAGVEAVEAVEAASGDHKSATPEPRKGDTGSGAS